MIAKRKRPQYQEDRPGQRGVYYGWWILTGCVIGMALGSGVTYWAFGLYIQPLEEEFGWSRAQVSLGISIALLTSGASGPLVGRWIDARGPRSVIAVAAAMMAVSWILLSTTSHLWQWYLYLSFNGAFWVMLFVIPFQSLASRWFQRRRGIALSALGAGFSLGGFVVVPVMRAIIDNLGWRTSFLVSAGMVVAVFLPMTLLLFRDDPAEVGSFADGQPRSPRESSRQALTGLSLGEALRTPLFWLTTLAVMLFFYGVFGWLVHQVPFYESVGVSRSAAALIVSVSAGFTILSRLASGMLADNLRRIETLAMGLLAFLMAAMTMLILDSSTVGIAVFVVLWTVGSGASGGLWSTLISRSFGLAHFGAILGALMVVQTIGQIVSPAVAGAIYDSTGSYRAVLIMFLGSLMASWCLFYLANRLPRPHPSQVAVDESGVLEAPPGF